MSAGVATDGITEIDRGTGVVGQSVPRLEAEAKVTGRGRYFADLNLPRMLHARLVRSPLAHARVVAIDASAALALPGVHSVVSALNIDDLLPGLPDYDLAAHREPDGEDHHGDFRLFGRQVRYAGEPVAAVLAETDALAQQAAALIDVEYEELPAVFELDKAGTEGAPLVHHAAPGNLASKAAICFGNVEDALAGAALVLERDFVTQRQKHAQLEPSGALADVDSDGKVTVWSPNHGPHKLRGALAKMFSLPLQQMRVIVPLVGGSFGKSDGLSTEPYAAALALIVRRPVKLRYSRMDDFVGTDARHPTTSTLTVGFRADGTIAALRSRALFNAGAYLGHSDGVPWVQTAVLLSSYRIEHADVEACSYYTNTPVTGAFRGYGGPQACFPLEHMIDLGCRELGVDPLEARERMCLRAGDPWRGPKPVVGDGFAECLARGAQAIGWREKRERKPASTGTTRRGVGMGATAWISGGAGAPGMLDYSGAIVRVNSDGSLTLFSAGCDLGTGLRTTLAQICAEELGVPLSAIRLSETDTEVTPFDSGAHASRSLYRNGQAVQRAAADARRQVLEYAAEILEVTADDLELRDGMVAVRGVPDSRMTLEQVAQRALLDQREFYGHGGTTPGDAPPFIAQFAEVEVDTETGQIRLLQMVSAADVGQAINPSIVEGQIQGAAHQGIGYALSEDLIIDGDTGTVLNGTFMDYRLLTSLDAPSTEVILVEQKEPSGPFGAKGAAELGIVPTAAAIANAVLDATGVSIRELPLTPERVLAALHAAPSPMEGDLVNRTTT